MPTPTISVTPSVKVIKLNSTLSNTTILTLNVSGGQVNITLEWTNFTFTTLNANKTSWTNFQGIDTIEINVTRTSQENKSRRFELNFICSTQGCNNVSVIISTAILKHPFALFGNISETPGYIYNSNGTAPYTNWHNSIIFYGKYYGLDYDFCNQSLSAKDKAWRARGLAESYLLEYNVTVADKAVEALYCINVSAFSDNDRFMGFALIDYALAFDWMHEYIIEHNETIYYSIRDKIAHLADECYKGIPTHTNAHDKTILASACGIASIVLKDYDSDYSSTPDDWFTAGTTWLFINDSVGNRAILNYYNNRDGLSELGGYKGYWIDALWKWANVYNYQYKNVSEFAILKNIFNEVLWIILPNGESPSQNTRDNLLDGDLDYSFYILETIPLSEARQHFRIIDNYIGKEMCEGTNIKWFCYLLYDMYKYSPSSPNWTTYIPPNKSTSEFAIFRKDWSNTSSYLFFKFFNFPVDSNRAMTHHDSMSFDYYDKGDYLLIDSGEVKHREYGYGPVYGKGHNTIMISDGMNSNPGAPTKGLSSLADFENPAYLQEFLIDDLFGFVEAEIPNWTKIEETLDTGEQNGVSAITLSDPVKWRRAILFPNKEYFIVLDYLNNSQQRLIYNLFHLGSFRHSETNSTFNGSVYGNLSVEGEKVDWVSQTYNEEVNIANGSELKWNTTNINDKKIQMHLYSIPESEISVEKFFARLGKDRLEDEVDHPLVRFKLNTSEPLYRIAAFYTRYTNETEWTFTNLSLTGGQGNALKISNGSWVDWIVHANGSYVTADKVKTDGTYAWVRNDTGKKFFMRSGKNLTFSDVRYFSSNDTVEYMLMNISGKNATITISAHDSLYFTVHLSCSSSAVVKRSGETLTYGEDWGCVDSNEFWIKSTFSEQTFTILGGNNPPQISNLQFDQAIIYTDTSPVNCSFTITDADGDTMNVTASLYNSSNLIRQCSWSGQTNGTTLNCGMTNTSEWVKGNTLYCNVSVSDGTNTTKDSVSKTISNKPPTCTSSSQSITLGQTKTVVVGTCTDPDYDDGIDTLTWSSNLTSLMITATFDTGTSESYYDPYSSLVGTHSVSLQCSDGEATAECDYTLTIMNVSVVTVKRTCDILRHGGYI